MKLTKSRKLLVFMFIYLIAYVELNQRIFGFIKDIGERIGEGFGKVRNGIKGLFSKSKAQIELENRVEDHNPCVRLCTDTNLQGRCDYICEDKENYGILFKPTYKSSLVGRMLRVIVFSEENFKGASFEYNEIKDFESFSPKSHMILRKGCAIIFDSCEFLSINYSAVKICDTESDIKTAFKFEINSIILESSTKPKIFGLSHFKGYGYLLKKTVKCIPMVFGEYKINSIHIVDPIYSEIYMSPNPFINFIIGTAIELSDNEDNLTKCFPEDWKTQVKSDQVNNSDNNLKQWNEGMSTFNNENFLDTILNIFCEKRQYVIQIISGLFSLGQRRRYLKSSLMELNSKRKMSKSLIKRTYNSYKNISSIKVNRLINILGKIFENWINPIKEKITGFVNKIIQFFESELFKKIFEFVECVNAMKYTFEKIKEVFKGIKSKYEMLTKKSKGNIIIIIIIIVDFLVAFICERQQFTKAINFFKKAWNESSVKFKWLLYGKSIGKFLKVIGTAQTFSETIYGAMKKDISK